MLLAIPQPAQNVPAMYWQRTFPGAPEQAGAARNFLRTLLPEHPSLDDMLLATDELVVNAIRHTRSGATGGTFRLEVLLDADGIAISVTDQGGPKEPTTQTSGTVLSECGRGLTLVTALARSWTWSGDAQSRTISARFPAA